MKKITVNDTTLFSISKAGRRTAFKDRVETARLLDAACVDAIELPEFSGDKTEEILIKSVCAVVKNATVAVRVPLLERGFAKKAYDALNKAQKSRLQVSCPVSAAMMEFYCHKKPAKIGETIKEAISECLLYTDNVEFIAMDVLGGEFEVLITEIESAIEAGAKVITLEEPSGVRLPAEIGEVVKRVRKEVKGAENITLLVNCSDSFNLGLACSVEAIKSGADGVKTAVYADFVNPVDLAEIARQRANEVGFNLGLNVTVLSKIVDKVSWILSDDISTKGYTGADLATKVVENKLCGNDSIEKISAQIEKLGYSLSCEDLNCVYNEFLRISNKKTVGSKELEAIIATTALQVPSAYKLVSYVINSGNIITSTANIKLEKEGKELSGICIGDGPIDAAFKAVEQIIGHHYELDDFQIQSVTEGQEAIGSALVKLRSKGKLYSGQGISTDIIGASIRAYINALNKIVYEED